MISSNPSPMAYFSRLAAFNDAVNAARRFSKVRFQERGGVKAGDPGDCGHERKGGEFTEENECAEGDGSEEWEAGHQSIMKEQEDLWEREQHYGSRGIYDKDLPPEYRGILKTPELAKIDTHAKKEIFLDLANQAVNNKYGP